MSRYVAQSSAARDSLELASLASSSHASPRNSTESTSSAGISSSRKLSLDQDDPLDSSNPAGISNGRPNQGHSRSFSVSSAFDFTSHLLPLGASNGDGYAPIGAPIAPSSTQAALGGSSLEKHKSLTYLNGLSLVVGLIIGSGIFSSPGEVVSRAGSPGASLIIWTIAGVLAWTGAASYAELGGAIPLNGGAQIYLTKIFGELTGFLFMWCAVLVLKPGSTAIIAIVFGEYLVRAAVGAEAELVSPWINKGMALAGLSVVTFINCVSTRLATRMGDMFMFLKFIALLGVTVIGIVVALTGFSASGEANQDWKRNWFEGTSTSTSAWAVAIYAGLWAVDGWDNTNYVVGEFRNPGRDLPRVLHTAMPLIILSYTLANVAYFFVLPIAVIKSTNTIAVMFGAKVFGGIGSLIFAIIVSLSCFGALNATSFTSGRLVYAAGKEGFMPSMFGRIGVGSGAEPSLSTLKRRSRFTKVLSRWFGDSETGLFFTPVNAIVFNAMTTAAYILVGEFSTLVTFYGVAGYTFYFLTVLGLIVLRVKEPHLERPYKTWISTPIIFCCVSLFLLSRSVFAEPVKTLIVVGFVVAGVPVYWLRIYGRDKNQRQRSGSIGPWWKFWKRNG